MDVILDTCALLSLAGVADRPLSTRALQAIRDADCVYISACSCFELCLKQKRCSLNLDYARCSSLTGSHVPCAPKEFLSTILVSTFLEHSECA